MLFAFLTSLSSVGCAELPFGGAFVRTGVRCPPFMLAETSPESNAFISAALPVWFCEVDATVTCRGFSLLYPCDRLKQALQSLLTPEGRLMMHNERLDELLLGAERQMWTALSYKVAMLCRWRSPVSGS